METSGRERRHRYYTVANYYKLVSEEAFDKSSACFTDIDLVNIGRFNAIPLDSFYENDEELVHRQDAAKDNESARGSEPKKSSEGKPSVSNVQSNRGRPRKPSSIKEKEIDGTQGSSSAKRKRKASSLADDNLETSGSEEPLDKMRRVDVTGSKAVGKLSSSSFAGDVLFSGAKRGRPRKAKASNQLDMGLRRRGRPSLRTEAQDLPVPSSIPQSDIDSNLDHPCSWNIRASKRDNCLGQDTVEHSLISVSIPPDPLPPDFPQSTQKQYRPIIANRSPTPSAAPEEKQSAGEQRIDDPMSPLSPCTETSTQNASPARSTISLYAGSITVSGARHPMFY